MPLLNSLTHTAFALYCHRCNWGLWPWTWWHLIRMTKTMKLTNTNTKTETDSQICHSPAHSPTLPLAYILIVVNEDYGYGHSDIKWEKKMTKTKRKTHIQICHSQNHSLTLPLASIADYGHGHGDIWWEWQTQWQIQIQRKKADGHLCHSPAHSPTLWLTLRASHRCNRGLWL